jgi:spermidine synthase
MAEGRWITETLFDELGIRIDYRAKKLLHEARTGHQHLVLFEHAFFGKMLMLDGATQIASRDAFIYQEMMAHVPLFAHGRARDVLIVGGGDCAIAKEVLKHKTVRNLTQVEIDPAVIDFARRYFPQFTKPVFADRRFESVIDDGMRYLKRTERRFDAIIVDSTDPTGPGKVLFSEHFYAACKRRLNEGGILVTQNGVPMFQPRELTSSMTKFQRLFADAACYVAAIPTYIGGHMAMGWATDDRRLRTAPAAALAARYRRAGKFATRYWTPEVHAAAFALPRFMADLVANAGAG